MEMIKNFNTKTLDEILNKMVKMVTNSKNEIFIIGEQCRNDYESLSEELKEVKKQVLECIEKGDQLEIQSRFARKRLSEVSMHFKDYTEEEVKIVYERAHELQMELTINRQMEKQLRSRRDDLERRLHGLLETISRADHLVGQISIVLNFFQSDLKQMGEVLEDAKMKQEFGLKIIQAQEEERKRLSREIHDGPAQMMANVMMRSDLVERIFNEYGAEAAIKEVKSLKMMARNALSEVRRIIYDLRPMALDDLGLIPTLRKYLQTLTEYHPSINIEFKSFGEEKRLPAEYEVAIFRLVQESVQNALKHANADNITVKLEMMKNRIAIMIKDDGKGFDIKEKKEGSFGLLGMRERIEMLNGELSIDSKIGKGTMILIDLPIEKVEL